MGRYRSEHTHGSKEYNCLQIPFDFFLLHVVQTNIGGCQSYPLRHQLMAVKKALGHTVHNANKVDLERFKRRFCRFSITELNFADRVQLLHTCVWDL
jgi:hypothetical protein